MIILPPSENLLANIDACWRKKSSFLLLPQSSPISEYEAKQWLRQMPPDYELGHFAILTSGTTGQPKIVIGVMERAENLTRQIHALQKLESTRETIVLLPLSYSFAFVNQWVWSHVYERTLKLTGGLSAQEELQHALRGADEAMVCLVGAQLKLMKHFFDGTESFEGVTRVIFAGGQFPLNELPYVKKLFPRALVFNNYGCTEAMPRLTIRLDEHSEDASNVGYPMEGVSLTTSAEGEILFKSPYSATGILDSQGWQSLEGQWIGTGDIGAPVEDGSWRLLGRKNEVFKRFGEKIALTTLAQGVRSVWDSEVAFFTEPQNNGEIGHILILTPEVEKKDIVNVLKFFRKNYTRVFWPVRIECAEYLPVLANGKIDTKGLSSMADKKVIWQQRS